MNGGLPISYWLGDLTGSGGVVGMILDQVVRASVGGLVLAVLVWAVIRLWRDIPARVQCALWWAVGLKFLITLIWLAPIELALLPPPAQSQSAGGVEQSALQPDSASHPDQDVGQVYADVGLLTEPRTNSSVTLPASGREALLLIWLLAVAYGLVGIRRELATAAAVRHRSRPIDDPQIRRLFSMLRTHLGIRQHVSLRASEDIGVPLTMGWIRPVVLLPASSYRQRSKGELAMALGHELLHVRRLDLWAGWVPRLARCLFFFHPLAVLAAREYALAREAACDAELLRELGVAPQDYGRLLVRWRPRGHGAVSTDAVGCAAASSTFLHLKRRLEMLERPFISPRRPQLVRWIVALAFIAAVVPLRIVAQAPTAPAGEVVLATSNGPGMFERVLAVDELVHLDVVAGAGAITVRAGSAGEVRVVGRAQVRPGVRRRAGDIEEMIRQFESDPPVVVSGDVVRIGYDLDRDLQRYASISYDIQAPREAEVRLQTGSGRQEVSGISGSVEATAGSGTIRLNDIGGRARAQTGSGSIRAEGVAGTFTGRTGSGSVSLLQTAAGDVEVTTGSGSIRARLPADSGFDLDVQTGSGSIQSDHPVTIQGTFSRGRLSGQVRGGGPVLRLRTGSGSVRIE